jgi:hypothetical protein
MLISHWFGNAMEPNGTAIVVVCVTGEAIRQLVQFVGREQSRWQARYAVGRNIFLDIKNGLP